MLPYDLLAIGDSSIDLYMKVYEGGITHGSELCFIHGSKVPVERFKSGLGGNACNVAVGASLLGLSCGLDTELGDDANAEIFIKEVLSLGVDTSFCNKNSGTPSNVHAVIVYGGERTIFSYHEPRKYKLKKWVLPKWIYYSTLSEGFESYQNDLLEFLNKHPEAGFIFAPGTSQLKLGKSGLANVLSRTDILFVNKEEAQKLAESSSSDLLELHRILHQLGPKLTSITDGANGASYFADDAFEFAPAVTTKNEDIVDKTGAGDAYASAFISAIVSGKTLKEAMKWGLLNSSAVIRQVGATNGLLTREKLYEYL